MSHLKQIVWLIMTIALLGLTACGGGAAATPTVDPGAVYTAAVETAYVQLTQTAMAVVNTPVVVMTEPPAGLATPTITPLNMSTPRPSNTPLITNTPSTPKPTNTAFSLVTAGPTQAACDKLLYLGDDGIDGSSIAAGNIFTKTWSIQNLGPCTWTRDYILVFGWGDPMGVNYAFYNIFSADVAPGDSVDITIDLIAPAAPGSYSGAWRVQNNKGYNFGTTLTVSIVVP